MLKGEIFKAPEENSLGNGGRKLPTWKTKEEITEVKLIQDHRVKGHAHTRKSLQQVTAGRAV